VVDFGCAYCKDDQCRWYDMDQLASQEDPSLMILIKCPRCGTLYENTSKGEDRTRRLTEDEAEALFPNFRR
jgi:phage FluMu protein Com